VQIGDWDKDRTSSSGRFELRVPKAQAREARVTAATRGYLFPVDSDRTITKKSSKRYVTEFRLTPASVLSGLVMDEDGDRVRHVTVRAFTADGKQAARQSGGSLTANSGFRLEVPAGDYKLQYTANPEYEPTWLGDVATADGSPLVHVGYAETAGGLDAHLTELPHISGTVTVDGRPVLASAKESFATELEKVDGTLVDLGSISSTFYHGGLAPGDYVLTVRPEHRFNGFTEEVRVPVTVSETESVEDLVVNTSVAKDWIATPTVVPNPPTYSPTKGKAFRLPIRIVTYKPVEGAKLTVYAGKKKIASRTVPASGELTIGTRFSGVKTGKVALRFVLSETDHTKRVGRVTPITLKK
jgi:hypothetical protein